MIGLACRASTAETAALINRHPDRFLFGTDKANYERLFDEAPRRVRAWEKENVR